MEKAAAEIIAKAQKCTEKDIQLWISNDKFKEFAKKIDNLSLNDEGHLLIVKSDTRRNLRFEMAIEKCQTANAFAKIVSISEVNWYTGAETKSLFKSPENGKEILIL